MTSFRLGLLNAASWGGHFGGPIREDSCDSWAYLILGRGSTETVTNPGGRAIKSLGFDGVDLTVRPGGSVLPENVRKDLPAAQKIFADLGLDVPLITTAITNTPDAHVADIFETAAACGIRELKLGYVAYKKFGSFQSLLAEVHKDLDGITSLAHTTGVRANIHTHSGPYISTQPAIIWQLINSSKAATPPQSAPTSTPVT